MTSIDRRGGVTVIRPDQPLQRSTVEALAVDVANATRVGLPLVVLDLTETPLIDSAGLEWLLDLDEQCGGGGGCVCLCAANELCRDILRITGVGATLRHFDDLTEALGSFA